MQQKQCKNEKNKKIKNCLASRASVDNSCDNIAYEFDASVIIINFQSISVYGKYECQ